MRTVEGVLLDEADRAGLKRNLRWLGLLGQRDTDEIDAHYRAWMRGVEHAQSEPMTPRTAASLATAIEHLHWIVAASVTEDGLAAEIGAVPATDTEQKMFDAILESRREAFADLTSDEHHGTPPVVLAGQLREWIALCDPTLLLSNADRRALDA